MKPRSQSSVRSPQSSHRGIALITAMLLISVVSVLLGGISIISMTNLKFTGNFRLRSGASLAAQGGMNIAEAFVSELFYAGLGDNTLYGLPGTGPTIGVPGSVCDGMNAQVGPTTCVQQRLLPPNSPPSNNFWGTIGSSVQPNLQNVIDNPEFVFRYLDCYFEIPRIDAASICSGGRAAPGASYQRFVVWPSQPVGDGYRYRVMIVASRFARQPTIGEQYSRSITIRVVGVTSTTANADNADPSSGTGRQVLMNCNDDHPQVVLSETLVFQVRRKRGYASPNLRLHPDYVAAEINYHPGFQKVDLNTPDPNVFWYNNSIDTRSYARPINPNPYVFNGVQAAATLTNSTSDFFFINYAYSNLLGRSPNSVTAGYSSCDPTANGCFTDEVDAWSTRLNYRVGDLLNAQLPTPPAATTIVAGLDAVTSTSADTSIASLSDFHVGDYVQLLVKDPLAPAAAPSPYYATITAIDTGSGQITWQPALVDSTGTSVVPAPGDSVNLIPDNRWPPLPAAPAPLAVLPPNPGYQNPTIGLFPESVLFNGGSYGTLPADPLPPMLPPSPMPTTAPPPLQYPYPTPAPPNWPPAPLATSPDKQSQLDWPFYWPDLINCPNCTGAANTSPLLSVLPGGQFPTLYLTTPTGEVKDYEGIYVGTSQYHRSNDLLYTLMNAYPPGATLPPLPPTQDQCKNVVPGATVLQYVWNAECGKIRTIDPVDSLVDQTFTVGQTEDPYRLLPSGNQNSGMPTPAYSLNLESPPFAAAIFPPDLRMALAGSAAKCAATPPGAGQNCTHELSPQDVQLGAPAILGAVDPATLAADDWVWEDLYAAQMKWTSSGMVCCARGAPCP